MTQKKNATNNQQLGNYFLVDIIRYKIALKLPKNYV